MTESSMFGHHGVLIPWKPEYELGIPIIDEQHRGLVAAINSLHCAVLNEFGEKMIEPVIGMTKEYTLVHFATEEFFLKKCGFPDMEQHCEQHKGLMRSLFEVGQESVFNQDSDQMIRFLQEWLLNHILTEDQKYREYLLGMQRHHP